MPEAVLSVEHAAPEIAEPAKAADPTTAPRGDTAWVHAVRAVAILFVVVLHVAAEPFYMGVKAGTYDWWVANAYNSATRICVPLFFMLTGHLLLGTRDTVGVFYKKRAKRIVAPWLTWSLVYLALVDFYEIHHPSGTSAMTPDLLQRIVGAGWKAVAGIALFPMYYHLWFLYALIWIYLWLPLWRRIVRRASPATLWGIAVFWAVVSTILTFTRGTRAPLPVMIAVALFYTLIGAMGYPILGYLLGRVPITRRLCGLMVGVAVAGTLTTTIGTYVLTVRNGGVLDQALHGDTLNLIASSAAAFVILRYFVGDTVSSAASPLFRTVRSVSATSFGLYLAHPLLLYALSVGTFGFKATALSSNGLYMIPLLALAIVLVSHFLVRGLQRVPYVRALAG